MLNFEAFMDYVGENVLKSFPEEFKNAEVKIEKVAKSNVERYGLTVRLEDVAVTPNLYLESYYDDYRKGETLDNTLSNIAEGYKKAMADNTFTKDITFKYSEWDFAKEHIVFDLIGKEQNKEFNINRPNRDFLDLSIIYRVVISSDERGLASTIVTNDLMKKYNVTEEDLYKAAYENTRKIFKPKVATLEEVIGAMLGEDIGPCPLFLVSNEAGINGAAMIIYDDVLQDLSTRIFGPFPDVDDKRELIIFPSSRHEMLALDANMTNGPEIEYCQAMVQEINNTCVALEDRLSNNVYRYDALEHKLSMATDVPNRRLDDIGKEKDIAI